MRVARPPKIGTRGSRRPGDESEERGGLTQSIDKQ
jgi:hypothetical protein